MKTAIIILAIICVITKLISKGCENYIKNDKNEAVKYYFRQGATTLGAIYSITYIISTLTFSADLILLLILCLSNL